MNFRLRQTQLSVPAQSQLLALGDYIGIGCGAHGKVTFPDGPFCVPLKRVIRVVLCKEGIWKPA